MKIVSPRAKQPGALRCQAEVRFVAMADHERGDEPFSAWPEVETETPRACGRANPAPVEAAIDFPFAILAMYLLAQSYMVPVLAVGPWAAWLRIADVAFLLMPLAMILRPARFRARTRAHYTVFVWLALWTALCTVSYTFLVVLFPVLHPGLTGKSVSWGGFQVYRLAQFAFVFWYVSGLKLENRHWQWIGRILLFDFCFAGLSVLGTQSGLISTAIFGAHLPVNLDFAGPWGHYAAGALRTRGGGSISYNHGYAALQLVLIAAGMLHFCRFRNRWYTGLLLLGGLAAAVATGSRTGLIAYVILMALVMLPNLGGIIVTAMVAVAGGILLIQSGIVGAEPLKAAMERTSTILTSHSTDSFSGRGDIWKDRIEFLNQRPVRWMVGGGFGSALESGSNAHNQLVQTVIETGLAGLVVQLCFLATVLRLVALRAGSASVLVWLHLVLIIACVAQEVFSPLPKLGHLLGLYLVLAALALKVRQLGDASGGISFERA